MNVSEQSVLADVAKNESNAGIRRKAVKKLTNQAVLADVAQNDRKTDIRIMALKKLTDQTAIAEVAKHDNKTDVRRIALKKLTDQAAIFYIALNERKTYIRRMALKKLTDPEAIGEVAKNDSNGDIRIMALNKLKKLTAKIEKMNRRNTADKTRQLPPPDNNFNFNVNGNVIEVSETDESIDIDIFAKINSVVREIDLLDNAIDDSIISNEIAAIKSILVKIAAFLNEEKEKQDIKRRLERLDEFFGYYFPTIIKILDSYRQITAHKLDGGNALKTKKRISESIPVIRKAFEKELDNIYENKMLDITTDIDVLKAMLAKDGILDNNKVT